MSETQRHGRSYLRLTFIAYWQDAPPSAEIFFANWPSVLRERWLHRLDGIAVVEQDVTKFLQSNASNTLIKVTFAGIHPVEMTAEDVLLLPPGRVIS